jgi:large subunit ribosomal protein L15
MQLNSIKPAEGSKRTRKRVGRGIGSGLGKTGGRGHKGQKSRSGGFTKLGFEGGQMPLQRRLPKRGFRSVTAKDTAEVRLYQLASVSGDEITMASLRESKLIPATAKNAKLVLNGSIDRAVKVSGVRVSKGAKAAIESAGGTVSE